MTTTLKLDGDDLRDLIDVLVDACKVTCEEGQRPSVMVHGRTYQPSELTKVAALIPDGKMLDRHRMKVDAIFQKEQSGYRRTALNLANRANIVAANLQRQAWRRQRQAEV